MRGEELISRGVWSRSRGSGKGRSGRMVVVVVL